MGGFGTMPYAARHPDTFAGAADLSGFADLHLGPSHTPQQFTPAASALLPATGCADAAGLLLLLAAVGGVRQHRADA
jgi:S-formylglutathione hydrolase FrmB